MKKNFIVTYDEYTYSEQEHCFVPVEKTWEVSARSNVYASTFCYRYFASYQIVVKKVTLKSDLLIAVTK